MGRYWITGQGVTIAVGSGENLWEPDVDIADAITAHWDAAEASSISLSGSSVTAWADKVNAVSAVQGTGGNQPTYSATARNSRPGVTFDGTDDRLGFTATGFPTGSGAGSIFAVAFINNVSGWKCLYSQGTGSTNQLRALFRQGTTNLPRLDLNINGLNGSGTWNNADRMVFLELDTGGAASNYSNGETPTTATLSPNTTGTTAWLGAMVGPTDHWPGVIQELIIFNRALTDDETDRLFGYAAHRWGLTSLLPAEHPYKSEAPTGGGGGDPTAVTYEGVAVTHEGAAVTHTI